jgi:GT2 family glycosyltransferase
MTAPKIGVVAIGRSEGARLIACLKSLRGAEKVVYVDSGSTDGSVQAAADLGAEVVNLDMSAPFTAARARNAGARRLASSNVDYVQFIDGDCALDAGWLPKAREFLDANPDFAVACGRRRERRPDASIYNRLCDIEWDTPVGEAAACGGDALMRMSALKEAGFYDERLVAGEEPELCIRMRERGWRIERLDAEMTSHDAGMTKFRQWWMRAKRAGHAYAEISTMHAKSPKRIWRREMLRALVWTAIAPASALLGVFVHPAFLALFLAYPAQALRIYCNVHGRLGGDSLAYAATAIVGKFAETVGIFEYFKNRIAGRRAGLFEYK